MNSSLTSNPKKRIHNDVANMIICWLNNIDVPELKIKSVKDLKNGSVYLYLIKLILMNSEDCDIYPKSINDSISNRYDLIKTVIETRFSIGEGVNYIAASQGDEFELGKIALIILSNGIALDNKKVIESCENLDLYLYEIITDFYSILEREKSKFPPTSVALYEERLLIYNTNKKLSDLNATNSQTEIWDNTVNYFPCSPCPSYSTYVRDVKRKKIELDEDKDRDQSCRVRSLEKELLKKEILIFDLEDEVKEKQEKIEELCKKIKDYESILPKLNSYEQQAYEYDILIKEYEAMKKSKSLLQESFIKISYDLIEESENQEFIKSTNSILADQVEKLNNELECLKQKEKQNVAEIERLKQYESMLNSELILKMKNEKVFNALLDKLNQLEMRLAYSSEKLDHINYTYKNRIEELENENAQYQGINIALKNQLFFLNEENKQAGELKKEIVNLVNELRLAENHIDRIRAEWNKERAHFGQRVAYLSTKLNNTENYLTNLKQFAYRTEMETFDKHIVAF